MAAPPPCRGPLFKNYSTSSRQNYQKKGQPEPPPTSFKIELTKNNRAPRLLLPQKFKNFPPIYGRPNLERALKKKKNFF